MTDTDTKALATEITISVDTTITVDTKVTLPEGKVWADVDTFDVKWGTLHIWFTDKSHYEIGLNEIDPAAVGEIKRPSSVSILRDDDLITSS